MDLFIVLFLPGAIEEILVSFTNKKLLQFLEETCLFLHEKVYLSHFYLLVVITISPAIVICLEFVVMYIDANNIKLFSSGKS